MSSKSKSEQTNLDLFVAFGALTVTVVEAADPIDVLFNPGENTRANPNTKSYDVYLSIDISDPNHEIISSCQTATHQYQKGTLDFQKENCQFSGVFSYFKMRISLYADSGHKLFCTGLIDIPISRLEEDAVISQWYQLSHPGPFKLRETSDGIPISPSEAQPKSFIRSAVKLEILFKKEGMKLIAELSNSKTAAKGNKQQINSFNPSSPEGHVPGGPVPPKDAPNRPFSSRSNASSASFAKVNSSSSVSGSGGGPGDVAGRPASTRSNASTGFGRDHEGRSRAEIRRAEKEEQREREKEREKDRNEPVEKKTSSGGVVTRKPLFIDTNFDDAIEPPSNPSPVTAKATGIALATPSKGSLQERANAGIGLQRQATMTNNSMARAGTMTRSASMEVVSKETLPVGLIDYFLIIGPTSMPVGYNGSAGVSSSSVTGSRRGSFVVRKGDDKKGSDETARPEQQEPLLTGRMEVALWDRFPKEDHEDVPLPMKMEWFSCPHGARVYKSATRPVVKFSSFIMTSSDEELFGITLTFFVAVGDYAADTPGFVPELVKPKAERGPSTSRRTPQTTAPVIVQKGEEELTDSDNDTASPSSPRPGISKAGSSRRFTFENIDENESDSEAHEVQRSLPVDEEFVSAWTQEVDGLSTLQGKLSRGLPMQASFSTLSVNTAIQASKGKLTSASLMASAPSRDAFKKRGSSSTMSFKSSVSGGSFKNGLPSSKEREKAVQPQTWVGVTLCVMTRGPFVEQLSQCLHLIYIYYILPQLSLWEDQIRSDASFTAQRNSAGPNGEANAAAVVKLELENSLKLKIESILLTLVMECPVPMPGVFSVCVPLSMSFNSDIDPLVADALKKNINNEPVMCSSIFPGCDSHAKVATITTNSEMSLRAKNNVASQTIGIKFDLAPAEDLPSCPYPIYLFFEYLTPRTALDALACAHCECKLLFHSRDTAKLPIVCEAIRTLLYPMRWAHVYLPVVPGVLLDLLDAPVPYVLGISTDNLENVGYEYLRDSVVVDVDAGTIQYMEDVIAENKIVYFPDHVDRWLMLGIKMILNDGNTIGYEDIMPRSTTATGGGVDRERITGNDEKSKQLQILVFDCMVGLLRHVPDCLFFLDKTSPVFNRPLFLKEFVPSRQCEQFVQFLTSTTAFNQFAACIHDSSLSIFIEASQRMVLELTKAEELELAAEHTIGHHSEAMLTVERRRSSVMDNNTPVKVVASVAAAAAAHGNAPPPKGLTPPRRTSFTETDGKSGIAPRRGSFNDGQHQHHNVHVEEELMVDEMFPEWITATQMLLPQRHSAANSGATYDCTYTSNLRDVLNARVALYMEILDDTIPRFMDANGNLLDSSPVFTYTRPDPKPKTPKAAAKPSSSMSALFGKVEGDDLQVYTDDNIDDLFEELEAPAAGARKAGGRLSSSSRRTSIAAPVGLEEANLAGPGASKAPGALSRVSTLSRTATFTKKTIVTVDTTADGSLSVSTASPDKASMRAQRRSSTAGRRSSVGALNFQDVTKIVSERAMSTRSNGLKSQTSSSAIGKQSAFSFDSDDEDDAFKMTNATLKPLGSMRGAAAFGEMSEADRLRVASTESRRPSLLLLSGKTSKVACFYPIPAVTFDPATIDDLTAEHQNLKTLMTVAKTVGVDEREMFKAFKKIIGDVQPKSLSRWGLQNSHVQNILPPSVLEYMNDGRSAPTGAQSIAMFLQHAFASTTVTEEELDRMLTECETALQNTENRQLLMRILKQEGSKEEKSPKAGSPSPKKSKKAVKPAGWKVFPVQPKAYEDLKELCNILLHVCYEQRDYFMAHQLLEATGSYFTTIVFNDKDSDEDSDSDFDSMDEDDVEATTYCEFLSESICRHSIFQNPALWQVVMNNHIPIECYSPKNKSHFAPPTPKETKPVMDKQAAYSTAELIQEAKSLLYRMLQIGVAMDKALAFVKLVVSDYHLSVQQFFQLQRFTTDTWDESGDESGNEHSPGERDEDGDGEGDGQQLTEFEQQEREQQREREYQWGLEGKDQDRGGDRVDSNDDNSYDPAPTPVPSKGSGSTTTPAKRSSGIFDMFSPTLTEVSAITLDSFGSGGKDDRKDRDRDRDRDRNRGDDQYSDDGDGAVKLPAQPAGTVCLSPFVQAVAEHFTFEECSEDGIVIDKEVVEATVDILTGVSSVDMAGQWLVSGGHDGSIFLTNLSTDRFDSIRMKNAVGVTQVKLLPGGGGFVCTTADGVIKVFRCPSEQQEAAIPAQFKLSLLQLEDEFAGETSALDDSLASSHRSGFNSNPMSVLRVAEMKGHLDRVLVVAVSGFLLGDAAGTGGGWMVATGDAAGVVCIFKGNDSGVTGNGKASVRATLRSAGEITCLVLSCTNSGRYLGPMHPSANVSGTSSSHTNGVTTTASGAHETLAVGTAMGSVVVLDSATGKPVFRQERGHRGRVTAMVFRSASELLTGGEDECVRAWNLQAPPGASKAKATSMYTLGRADGCAAGDQEGLFGSVTALAVINGLVVCATTDNILRVWDVDQNHATPHLALRGHTDKITDIVWQLGDLMASASWDGSIRLWDLAKGAHVEEIRTGAAPDFPTSMDDGSFAQLCYSKNTNSAEKPTGSVVAFPSPCLVARSEQGAVKIWLR